MAILRSRDGKFYDIPDGELESMEVPAERLKEVLGDMGPEGEAGGGVEPYGWGFRIGWGWRNHWRNRWRNCWRNCY